MKIRGLILTLILIGILFVAFYNFDNANITGQSISIPSDCSNSEIKQIWDSVFKESSTGTTIFTSGELINTQCSRYVSYKIINQEIYFLKGEASGSSNSKRNLTEMVFIKIKTTQNNLDELIEKNSVSEISNFILDLTSNENNLETRSSELTSINQANITYNEIFKEDSAIWKSANSNYYFAKNQNDSLFNTKFESEISKEKSIEILTYQKWLIKSTSQLTGNLSNITTSNINLTMKIDNQKFDEFENYTDEVEIEILDNNQTFIEFEINLSETSLDLTEVEIKKQPLSSNFGYVIINQINAPKTIYVDKLISNSNQTCIKNSEINSISEISSECNESDEYFIDCPGSKEDFSCTISENKFVVYGLTNSAVMEFGTCIPNWSCTQWGNCINGIRERTCTDLNNCNTNQNKPEESETCCNPNWQCSEWTPKKCPIEREQTRICTDLNNCNTNQGKPSTTKPCEPDTNWTLIIIIIIGLLLIGAIIFIFLKFLNKDEQEQPPAQNNLRPSSKPPRFPPQQLNNFQRQPQQIPRINTS